MKVTVKKETIVYFNRQEVSRILILAAKTEAGITEQTATIVFEEPGIVNEEVNGVTLTFRDE